MFDSDFMRKFAEEVSIEEEQIKFDSDYKRLLDYPNDLNDYIVTLYNESDLSTFYNEMESLGGDSFIPTRVVRVTNRRPKSLNTHYELSYNEAIELQNDPRVNAVFCLKFLPKVKLDFVIDNGRFNRSSRDSSFSSNELNWGLYAHGTGNFNFGVNDPNDSDVTDVTIYNDVTITSSGKNVDALIVDGHIDPSHPEFTTNPDGTGSVRVIQENWFIHDSDPNVGTYIYTPYTVSDNSGNHGSHVASTTAGNRHGWAREANIYNINPLTTNPNVYGDSNSISPILLWDYITEWHDTKSINPSTGRKNPTISNNSWTYATNNRSTWVRFYWDSNDKRLSYNSIYFDSNPTVVTAGSGFEAFPASSSTNTDNGYVHGTHLGGTADNTCFINITSTTGGAGSGIASCKTAPAAGIPAAQSTYPKTYYNVPFTRNGGSGASEAYLNVTIKDEYTYYNELAIEKVFYKGNTYTKSVPVDGRPFNETELNSFGLTTETKMYNLGVAPYDKKVVYEGQTTSGSSAIVGPTSIDTAILADQQRAIDKGIIIVAAAGNQGFITAKSTDSDYNNYFVVRHRSIGRPAGDWDYDYQTIYYHRRGINRRPDDVISVGALAKFTDQRITDFSQRGSGVDIFAAGDAIIGTANDSTLRTLSYGTTDPRNNSYDLWKTRGTSMASPQISGILACLVEHYPNMNQQQAKAWLIRNAVNDIMRDDNATHVDDESLQGAPNRVARWYNYRPVEKNVFPNNTHYIDGRPTSGRTYPRHRIRRRG